MKKAFFFAGLAAAVLSLAGCNREADVPGHGGRKVQIVLSDVDTRTVNDGLSTVWKAGDELSVFNAPAGTTTWSANTKFTVEDASANRATGEVELTADAYDWYAFYPYTRQLPNPTTLNPEGSQYERSGYTTVGGQFQSQKEDDNKEHLAGVKVPVFGHVKNVPAAETPAIEMKNAAAVVRFKISNAQTEEVKILSVKFTAPEDIVGTYYIDFSGDAPAFVGSGENYVFDNVTVTNSAPVNLAPDSNSEFFAVIKPYTAAAGAKLKVEVEAESVDGTKKGTATKEITLTVATEFKSGVIKTLTIPFDATMKKVTAQALPYEEAFADGAGDFTIENVTGSGIWNPATASGQKCMKGTSYLSGQNTEGESWLISPEIDATAAENGVKLSFKQCINKYFGNVAEEATLWARKKDGDWKQFTITYPALNGTWSAFEEQVVDLSEFKGETFQFAFKYVGHATAAGTWEICNVAVTDEAVSAYTFHAELEGESIVPANTTSVTIKVTGNVAWTAVPSEGVTLDKTSGEGSATITASFAANTEPVAKNYSVIVGTDNTAVENDEFEITFSQAAASTEAKAYPFEETFASSQGDFTIDNVKLDEGLSYVWKHDASNKYMKASAYAGSNKESESWLISPLVDMTGATNPMLYFSQCINKFFGDVTKEATVWIKEEGGAWTQLAISYPEITSGNWSKMTDYTVDIKSYAGKKVQVAFKYTSSTTAAGTWEVKSFKLDEAVTGPVDPTFTVPATLTVEEGKTAKINVTTNTDGAITYTSASTAVATVAADGTVTGVAAGTTTITVAAAATAAYNAASATVAVTVTEAQTGTHYGKVNTITSGKKYLIVGGNQNVAMVPPTGTAAGRPSGATVTISSNKIAADETTNAYAVTLTKNGDDVSIVLPNANYLVYSGSSTGVKGSAEASDFWNVSAGEFGTFRFAVKSTPTRSLAYRSGDSNCFGAYASVNGTEYFDIDLYELGAEPASGPVNPSLTVSNSINVQVGSSAKITVNTNSDGAVSYASSATSVATVAADGTVTGVAPGTATITVSVAATANFNAASKTVPVTVTAAGEGGLTFSFSEKSSETGTDQWPAKAADAASTQTYTLSGTVYTFELGKDTYMGTYNNANYLMIKSGSYLGLPAIEGKKLVRVVYTTSGGASTGTYGAICTDSAGATPVSGGESIALNQTSTDFSWNLTGTAANTMYYFVASKKNSQTVKIVLTYE